MLSQHASGTYFTMTKTVDRTASPAAAFSSSTIKHIVSLLYDAFGESLVPYIRSERAESPAMLDLCL